VDDDVRRAYNIQLIVAAEMLINLCTYTAHVFSCCCAACLGDGHLGGGLLDLVDVARHVEGALGQVVQLAG